jgi:predicted CoA-binding protein
MENTTHHVVVLGASPKPHRYSNRAIKTLKHQGYAVTPVHPNVRTIEELPVANRLDEIHRPVHTLTCYVGPQNLKPLLESVMLLSPERVIFNPGTESQELERCLETAGIPWLRACTLVMLHTNTF